MTKGKVLATFKEFQQESDSRRQQFLVLLKRKCFTEQPKQRILKPHSKWYKGCLNDTKQRHGQVQRRNKL